MPYIKIIGPVFLLIIVGIWFCIHYEIPRPKKLQHELRFELEKNILTQAEQLFFITLKNIISPKTTNITIKIRLEDVIKARKSNSRSEFYSNRGRIKSRHIDFLITDITGKPLIAIELDDKSHNSKKAKEVDKFKDEICKQTGLPLLRIKTATGYDLEKIKTKMLICIKQTKELKNIEARNCPRPA